MRCVWHLTLASCCLCMLLAIASHALSHPYGCKQRIVVSSSLHLQTYSKGRHATVCLSLLDCSPTWLPERCRQEQSFLSVMPCPAQYLESQQAPFSLLDAVWSVWLFRMQRASPMSVKSRLHFTACKLILCWLVANKLLDCQRCLAVDCCR